MTDQVDNTQNPLIPPPKKDELSQADPNQFKQVMKELSTDTEQKGKWKPQKEDLFDGDDIGVSDDTDDVTTPFVSGDTDIGETTQAASSAASSQVNRASQTGFPDNGEEDGIITPQTMPASGAQAAQPLGQEELPGTAPISLTRSEKMGGAALDKKGIEAGEVPSEKPAGKTAKQQADAAEMAGVPLPTAPIAQDATIIPEKEKVKTKQGSSTPTDLGTQVPQQQLPLAPPLTTLAPAAYTQMVPVLQEFFQKLVGVLTVMKASGVSETVIKLNAPAGSRLSIFNGSEISIKEYSSAPKIFNIQFNGNPEAANLVQGNLGNLMVALSDKEYNFKVNRFDVGLVSDKDEPLFKRKGAISGDDAS